MCRLLAPFAPFVSDWMHRELTGESVHLAPFVAASGEPVDATLDAAMAGDPHACAARPRGARGGGDQGAAAAGTDGVRRAECDAEAALEPLLPLLAAELNVKQSSSRRRAMRL